MLFQARLGLPTRELPAAVLVAPLGLDTVELVRKSYADSPSAGGDSGAPVLPRQPQPIDGSGFDREEGRGDSRRRTTDGFGGRAERVTTTSSSDIPKTGFDASTGRLTPSSATAYQEWPVVKTNHRQRRQERILGIDLTRLVNKKVEKMRLLSSDKPTHSERLIADIFLIEVMDSDTRSFAIIFNGADSSGERLRVMYEARTAADRDSIINKLAYILGMNGDRHKLRRST